MAGVNAAKVRKDLSYLGSYGTRGVGYDVEYLFLHINRVLGLTQDWPVVIVGVGNLGHALANYGGFSARGFRIVALVDADRRRVGEFVGRPRRPPRRRPARASPPSTTIAIGIIATPAAAAQDVADRLVAAGVTSILNFAPAVITVPPGVSLRKVDLSIELQILAFYQQRWRAGQPRRHRRWPLSDDLGPCQYPVNLVLDGRRCLVVGGGSDRPAQGRGPAGLRGRRSRWSPPRSTSACAHLPGVTVEERPYRPGRRRRLLAGHRRHRRPAVNRAVFDAGQRGRRVGQRGRRPGQLLVHPPVGRPPGRPAGHRLHRRPQPRPRQLAAPAPGGRDRPRVRGPPRPAGLRARPPQGRRAGPPRASTWQSALDSDMLDLIRTGDLASRPRASAGMSLVVVGLSHRTAPLELLERMAVPAERLPKALGDLVGRDFVSEAVVLSTCHRTEIYAVAERFHGGHGRRPPLPLRAVLRAARGLRRPPVHLPRRGGRRPPVRGDRRPRLGGRGRDPDPRPGPRRLGAGPRGGGGRDPAVAAVPPRPRGRQAGPHRDRHRPGHHVAVAGRGGHGHRAAGHPRRPQRWWSWAPARWAPAWSTRWPRPTSPGTPGHRRQPHLRRGPCSWPSGSAAGPSTSTGCRRPWPTPTCCSLSTGSPHGRPHRRRPRRRSLARRPGRPAADRRPGHAPRHRPRGGRALPGVTLLDLADLERFVAAGLDERRKEVGRVRAIVAEEVERFVGGHRRAPGHPARSPPCTSGPRSCGWPSWPATATGWTASSPPAGGGRGPHPEPPGQAAPRAHRAAQGGGRLGPGRAPGRSPHTSSSTSDGTAARPGCGRPPGRARWPGSRRRRSPRSLAAACGIEVEPVVVDTRRRPAHRRSRSGPSAARGVFVKEVQAAVLDGRADFAVHSAKDLPSSTRADGLVLAAVPAAGRRPRRPRRRAPRRPAAGGPHRHRLGPPPGPAGLAAARPHLRRPAGEHGHPPGQGRPASPPSWWPPPPSTASAGARSWPRSSTRT